MFTNYLNQKGVIIVTDPEIVNELYISKNKYFEKSDKMRRQLGTGFVGRSILFEPSNEFWAMKRKRIASAFYKDKLTPMLQNIVALSNQQVKAWKSLSSANEPSVPTRPSIDITNEISNFMTECVLQCVFGTSSKEMGRLAFCS